MSRLQSRFHLIDRNHGRCSGFTVIEIVIAIAILATLVGIAIPTLSSQIEKARIARCVVEIRGLERAVKVYETANEVLPDSLDDADAGSILDPWGRPYQYLRMTGAPGEQPRKDHFQVPLNTDFDLYSMGEDGDSKAPLTAQASQDDIVRANDGGYIGLASDY